MLALGKVSARKPGEKRRVAEEILPKPLRIDRLHKLVQAVFLFVKISIFIASCH